MSADFDQFGDFARLNVTRRHRLVVERLRVEVNRLVLVDGRVPRLRNAKRCDIGGLGSRGPRDRVVMLWIVTVRRHVCNLQRIDRGCLIAIVIRHWLNETLEVDHEVVVERDDVIRVIAVLRVEALSEEVNIAGVGLEGHFQGGARVMCCV